MQSFEIKLFIANLEETFQVKEENPVGTYIVSQNQKFISRLYKDSDGRWKSREVSDISPNILEAIGAEIEQHVNS
ncbi:hypothetical protein [Desertivirga xinjiangensis]|uniref:hypothetical protein n=1 Tax=Desertivirga xinjiangensis TaxID=539206 RepID=UPI00210EDBB4|nr:hypothetical protein [Pedobacter xinjiangensis]